MVAVGCSMRRAAQPHQSGLGDADVTESCVAGGRRSVSAAQPVPRDPSRELADGLAGTSGSRSSANEIGRVIQQPIALDSP